MNAMPWQLILAIVIVIAANAWQLRDFIAISKNINRLQKLSKEEKGVNVMLSDDKKFWGTWGQANALYTRWADAHEINYYLLFVLYALDGQEAMTQKMICDCTGLTKQTVNSIVRSLKNEGYVILSPSMEDRREKQVALTEKGIAYSQEVLAPLHELERTVLTRMGSDRVAQMINDITLFNTVFEKEMEKKLK